MPNKQESKFFCNFLVAIVVICFSIFIAKCSIFKLNLTKPLKANYIEYPPPILFEGNLKSNNLLEKAKYIAHKKLLGPETIVFYKNGSMFTGLVNGQIVRIEKDETKVHKVVQIGDELDETICNDIGDEIHSHSSCGRPLGLRIKDDFLYVADSYYGILKIDLNSGSKILILSSNDSRFGDSPLKFVNDLDFDGDKIYFIDSSYERGINEAIEEYFECLPRGRLFSYNEKTDTLEFILDNLYFPNGLQLMPDKESILINENTKARILRYYLSGPKKGNREVFVDLPGFGDTIRLTDNHTLLVPLAATRLPNRFSSVNDFLGKYPLIKTILGSILNLRQLFIKFPKYGLLIEYNLNGRPLRSWHDPTGKTIECTTNAVIHNNEIYIGSFYNDFIAKVDY